MSSFNRISVIIEFKSPLKVISDFSEIGASSYRFKQYCLGHVQLKSVGMYPWNAVHRQNFFRYKCTKSMDCDLYNSETELGIQNTKTILLREGAKRKAFARDPIFGDSCIPKSLPLKENSITRVLPVARR